MVDMSLVNYVRQLLQMGYDINSIRNRLISSGYDIGAIDGAINYAYHPSAGAAPKHGFADVMKSKKFLAAFTAVIAITSLALLILVLVGGEAPQIGISVYLDSENVYQGEELSFSKTLTSLDEPGMVAMSYEVIDQIAGITAATSQESFSTQAVKRETSITIPLSTEPGSYILRAVATYGGQSAETTAQFNVLVKEEEAEEQEPAPETPPAAAGPDNDNDGIPDTTDTDDDNDGIPDNEDSYPLDHDNDGLPDSEDPDMDNDGILNQFDDYPYDRDNDGIPDMTDTDNDNDGIPDDTDTYPFDYDNDGVLDKDDDSTGRAYAFPAEQETAEISFSCTTDMDCNDYDICTIDSCVDGLCQYTEKVPCCGNFICEATEDSSSCPQDCKEELFGPTPEVQEMIDEIMEIAESNPEQAAARCDSIEDAYASDTCYSELAKKTSNNAFCTLVSDTDRRDKCYMYFVMTFDQFQLCEDIEKRILQNSCYSIKTLKSQQSEVT